MYEERRESFSIRDLILQVLFIVLFVFILVLLFPTKGYMKKYVKDSNGTTVVQQSGFAIDQLAVLYNQIFADNVARMKEVAVGYYTTERLPQEVGKTETMTLQQMYDKHLLLTLKDKNGEACNVTKSYVSVTKYDEEFQMKINLSCGSEEDFIIVYLGCYDYCKASGVCEKQTTVTTPTKPSTNSNTNTNSNTKPKCKVVNGKYYDANGKEVTKDQYTKSCSGSSTTKKVCEYKKVTNGSWGDYGEWSEWTTTKLTANDKTQVETKQEKVVTGYTTEKRQVGTKTETYISGYTTSKYISRYTTEKYISGYTTEKYISRYTTQKVQTGTKKVQVGTTTKTTTKKVAAGTTTTYQSSGSGPTVPNNTSEYIYKVTGSTTGQTCSGCATTTIYTWDVYRIETVYRVEQVKEEVPVYDVEPVYTEKQVPVYATRKVPVYSTRKVPVYATKKTPVYSTRKVPVYENVKVPVYGVRTLYRSRTRSYKGGTTDVKWSTCDPVDSSLTSKGYYLTGNVKEA